LTLTKKQAMALIGISEKTFGRRLKSGRYKPVTHDVGKFEPLLFTYEGVGLPEPIVVAAPKPIAAVPEPQPIEDRAPEVTVATRLGPIELKQQEDERFAQDYKRGLVGDSAGNMVDGTNEKWPNKGIQSLLGPQEPKLKVKLDGTEHMDASLVGSSSQPKEFHSILPSFVRDVGVDSDEYMEILNPGHMKRMEAACAAAGVKMTSEQERKSRNDRAMILEAFRTGTYSR
jgi:hypothetical protein